jgi:hypothetical protein
VNHREDRARLRHCQVVPKVFDGQHRGIYVAFPDGGGHVVRRLILPVCASFALILSQPRPDAAAAATQINVWESFVITETSCTGEQVTLQPRVHLVGTLTETPSGTTISGSFLNSVGGIATSVSGVKYVLRDGSTSTSAGYVSGDAAETISATIRFRLIRAGESASDDDLYFRALFQVTTNANGDLIVQFDKISDFECR